MHECAREQDVLDAIATGRWPARCDDELRAHVDGCEVCADTVEVAGPLFAERDLAWADARVPPATLVWWRAQVRAREQAIRAAARPLTAVYAAALVFFGAIAGGLLVALLPRLQSTAAAFRTWVETLQLPALLMPSPVNAALLMALCMCIVLAPLAIWLALAEE